MSPRVLVLNQFALPRSEGGGTRHADIFSRIPGWDARIIAGNRNHYTQRRYKTADPLFRLVPVPVQHGGVWQRLVTWLSYVLQTTWIGMLSRPLDAVYASTPHLLAPLGGWIVARARRVPFILEVRDLWPESFVAAGLMRQGGNSYRLLSALESFFFIAALTPSSASRRGGNPTWKAGERTLPRTTLSRTGPSLPTSPSETNPGNQRQSSPGSRPQGSDWMSFFRRRLPCRGDGFPTGWRWPQKASTRSSCP